GAYPFVVQSNLLLHRQVAVKGRDVLAQWLRGRDPSLSLGVLDLACGGAPVSISSMVAHFSGYQFEYTGVDVNLDQVEAARQFEYPDNVLSAELIEANAWDFPEGFKRKQFDIVYSGMNLHHGTPEEIYCLLLQVKQVLKPDGIFLNHDCYRPPAAIYL